MQGHFSIIFGHVPGLPAKSLRLCNEAFNHCVVCARCLIKCGVKYSVRKQKNADDFCTIRPFQVYIVYYIVGPLYFTMSWAFKIISERNSSLLFVCVMSLYCIVIVSVQI